MKTIAILLLVGSLSAQTNCRRVGSGMACDYSQPIVQEKPVTKKVYSCQKGWKLQAWSDFIYPAGVGSVPLGTGYSTGYRDMEGNKLTNINDEDTDWQGHPPRCVPEAPEVDCKPFPGEGTKKARVCDVPAARLTGTCTGPIQNCEIHLPASYRCEGKYIEPCLMLPDVLELWIEAQHEEWCRGGETNGWDEADRCGRLLSWRCDNCKLTYPKPDTRKSHAVSTTPRKTPKKTKPVDPLTTKFNREGKMIWYIDPISLRRMECTADTGCRDVFSGSGGQKK